MSFDTSTTFDLLRNHNNGSCSQAPAWEHAAVRGSSTATGDQEAKSGTENNGTGGQAANGTTKNRLNIAADEEAFRLRSQGNSYRQIGKRMGVDPAMVHRRVKRQLVRQKTILNERLEDVRDMELENMRVMESVLMERVALGEDDAIKLMLRVMETKRRYLKDIPLEHAPQIPWWEDEAKLMEECAEEATEPAERAREEGEGGSYEEGVEEWEEDDRVDPSRRRKPADEGRERPTSNKEQSNVERKTTTDDDTDDFPYPDDREMNATEFAKFWKDIERFEKSEPTRGQGADRAARTEHLEPGDPAREERMPVDLKTAQATLDNVLRIVRESLAQATAERQVTTDGEPSTLPSTDESTVPSTEESTVRSTPGSTEESTMKNEGVTKAESGKHKEKGGQATRAWHGY